MLYFSKLKIIFILIISLFLILIASSNLFKFDNNYFLKKNINLGLDLQGGSYLLLEIDNSPVIEQKLQNFSITLRDYFKEKILRLVNFKFQNEKFLFKVNEKDKEKVLDIFNDKESEINPYYERFKSHQFKFKKKIIF